VVRDVGFSIVDLLRKVRRASWRGAIMLALMLV